MPALARKHQLKDSLLFHVFNRSTMGKPIFHVEEDYLHFKALLKKYSIRFSLKIYHWVIMINHYHILLEIERPENISKFMAGINRAYTHYYDRTYNTFGYLWQGRFKSQPIQKERYLIACGRYIERNPVRAHIVEAPFIYPYSSAQFYCLGIPDGIVVEDPLYNDFGNSPETRRTGYNEFLRTFDTEEETLFRNKVIPAGDKFFKRSLIKDKGRYMPRRKGKPRQNNKAY